MSSAEKIKLAIWFSVNGDIRFISHRDTMRLWHRALVRTQLPVKFTCGFNPRMCMSLPLPRSVALGAKQELLLIMLSRHCDVNAFAANLPKYLPAGIELLKAEYVPAAIQGRPELAEYDIQLSDLVDKNALKNQIQKFSNSNTWPIERPAHGRHPRRQIDLREFITKLDYTANTLRYSMKITQAATARVNEVLEALNINAPNMARYIERTNVKYKSNYELRIMN